MREALPFGVGGGLVAIKTLLSRDPCIHANTAIEMIDAILKEHTAAQPAPVQEPVALIDRLINPEQHYEFTDPKKANAVLMSLCQEAADALAAQPEPNGWAISYDGKTPYAIWPEGDGPLLDLEVKRQGGTCCKLPIYTTPPAAQQEHEPENEPYVSLASVQEPVGYVDVVDGEYVGVITGEVGWEERLYTTPPAAKRPWVGLTDDEILKLAYPIRWQEVDDFEADKAVNFAQMVEAKLKQKNAAAKPAVPDAMTSADIQENIEYVAGWNDCRQAMLEMMK